jgi:hypothetical protein
MKRGQEPANSKIHIYFHAMTEDFDELKKKSTAEDFHFNMVQLACVVLSLALGYIIHQLTVRINYKST